jgi:hypothetical protein
MAEQHQNWCTSSTAREAAQDPLCWFVALESARKVNDFARAAAAQRQLERLGVRVTYLLDRKGSQHAT